VPFTVPAAREVRVDGLTRGALGAAQRGLGELDPATARDAHHAGEVDLHQRAAGIEDHGLELFGEHRAQAYSTGGRGLAACGPCACS
jgi:hypothetical protein